MARKSSDKITKTASVVVKVEPELKAEAEKLFSELGLTLSSAVYLFLRQSIQEGSLPFQIRKVDKHNKNDS